jgi:hypothetical protein
MEAMHVIISRSRTLRNHFDLPTIDLLSNFGIQLLERILIFLVAIWPIAFRVKVEIVPLSNEWTGSCTTIECQIPVLSQCWYDSVFILKRQYPTLPGLTDAESELA